MPSCLCPSRTPASRRRFRRKMRNSGQTLQNDLWVDGCVISRTEMLAARHDPCQVLWKDDVLASGLSLPVCAFLTAPAGDEEANTQQDMEQQAFPSTPESAASAAPVTNKRLLTLNDLLESPGHHGFSSLPEPWPAMLELPGDVDRVLSYLSGAGLTAPSDAVYTLAPPNFQNASAMQYVVIEVPKIVEKIEEKIVEKVVKEPVDATVIEAAVRKGYERAHGDFSVAMDQVADQTAQKVAQQFATRIKEMEQALAEVQRTEQDMLQAMRSLIDEKYKLKDEIQELRAKRP